MDALSLNGGESVLDIGRGWGGLAERLALEDECHVVGLTLSSAQFEHARTRLPGCRFPVPLSWGPPAGTIELRRRDFRDETGTFDRVVSIEMLEAVGKEYRPTYFARPHDRLRPGGVAVPQVITMAEEWYTAYERGADFIQKHIFPGGMLPADRLMRARIEAAGMVLDGVRNFGASYARTLADWRARFQRAWPRLCTMGFGERFKRKWDYLSYCEAGFLAGPLDVGLYRLHRPGCSAGGGF
jgi:cyclopropane-fatty-acyl-phospholipid synthase